MTDPVTIPLNADPYQVLKVPLSSQSVQITLQQRRTGLYLTLVLAGVTILAGVLCQDRTWLVRKAYLGMPGDLAFVDTQGTSDPAYSGLGGRFVLIYQEGQNAG